MNGFTSELDKAYVNKYSDRVFDWNDSKETKYSAEICLSILPTIYNKLHYMFYSCCKKWNECTIQAESGKKHLKAFLEKYGYDMPELINKQHTGHDVAVKLSKSFKSHKEFKSPPNSNHLNYQLYLNYAKDTKDPGVLAELLGHLTTYNNVCHLTIQPKPRMPCSVFEMLVWLNGLTYNRVYERLMDHIKTCFPKPKGKETAEYSDLYPHQLSLDAYPFSVTAEDVHCAVQHICSNSATVLTTILGTGNALTIYACRFSNNSFNFKYPNSGDDCFQTLLDVLRRVFPVFRFLNSVCKLSSEHHGWRDCQYGRLIRRPCHHVTSNQMTTQPTNQMGSQRINQMVNQTHNQIVNQHLH
ncbi:hypothetical protein, conserved [Babesia ovata]|uniref:Uncharacterized protein n=1 Tax=Babesia ovata TaxID=189622 RepID=A0A2H6KJ52_9APIC|nr:uncharacterized protein BOVATA_045040 [Babesia ovata]GBE63011.1 hypothetical protein, conserved [Babesia ovata]